MTYNELRAAGERPAVPWLAAAFMPGLAAIPPEWLLQLGNLEHCLAWVPIKQTAT